jgi:hypothetical protein
MLRKMVLVALACAAPQALAAATLIARGGAQLSFAGRF